MENASKALVMAGGILIAIMTISALLYAAGSWGVIPKAEDTTDAVKQLTAFNMQYESYAKQAIYGLDLVSVLNKAIDNNEKYGVSPGDRMYVDIEFEIKNDVDGVTYSQKKYIRTGELTEPKIISYDKGPFRIDKGYKLSILDDKINIDKFLDTFGNTAKFTKHNNNIGKDDIGLYNEYTYTSYATSEFKTRAFACTETEYDDEGRIKKMKFVELTQDDFDKLNQKL